MSDRAKYRVGQWVSFIRDNALCYGCIMYAKRERQFPQEWEYTTSAGVVNEDEILEAR